MIRFEIFESSAPSVVLGKETIGGGSVSYTHLTLPTNREV